MDGKLFRFVAWRTYSKGLMMIDGLQVIEPTVYGDSRGYFYESYNDFENPLCETFVQDNISKSQKGVVRGLHYQLKRPQGKFIYVIKGMIFDVAVDIRKNSPTYGKYSHIILSEKNHKQFYIPPGFAHGFMALDDENIIQYKCTEYYDHENDRSIKWDDPDIGIKWPHQTVSLSAKDESAMSFQEMENKKEYL